jgi:hypothetical protein
MYQIETQKQYGLIYRLAFIGLSAVCQYAVTTATLAATETTDTDSTHIDSVYSWGTWELEIEPATGPQVPVNRAINHRSIELQFRPNDNAAYMTKSETKPVLTSINQPPPVPVRQPAPAQPAVPVRPPAPVAPAIPVIRPDGSGPVIPGAIPTAPNRRR